MEDELALWEIHWAGEYDVAERDGSNFRAPFDVRVYVVAGSQSEALAKVAERQSALLKRYRMKERDVSVTAAPVIMGQLLVARSMRHDDRMGFYPNERLAMVELLESDRDQYELVVSVRRR
ncbi:MAG TPA: hypothetical protein VLF67_03630 [Candidatus Saccharimonas sp.]|nr:hypothetical protein [Candidatus Saccharimonas sp.]